MDLYQNCLGIFPPKQPNLNEQTCGDDDFFDKESFYTIKNIQKRFVPVADFQASQAKVVQTSDLLWQKHDVLPDTLELVNTGQSLLLRASWGYFRPYIEGSFLKGRYVFSYIEFVWGDSSLCGSVHRLDGKLYPLEMHAIYYSEKYENIDKALSKPGGVIKVVNFFKIEFGRLNPVINRITKRLKKIIMPKSTARLIRFPMSFLLYTNSDYFFCWSAAKAVNCSHVILMLVNSVCHPLTYKQLAKFRVILNDNLVPMGGDHRLKVEDPWQDIFFVNPSEIKPRSHMMWRVSVRRPNSKHSPKPAIRMLSTN